MARALRTAFGRAFRIGALLFEALDGHPSAAGHEAIATELDRVLQEELMTARGR